MASEWYFFVPVISASTELCGSETEIELTKSGETSTMTVTLSPIEHDSICKLRVTAPKTHVINMQFVEPNAEIQQALMLNHSDAHHPPCVMSLLLPENPKIPVWKGDICSDDPLTDVDLLTSDFKIIWNPPSNPSFTKGRKFVLTAVGQGQVCREAGQHTCMRIGWDPMMCVSETLLCNGFPNCPKSATTSDEDEKLCKKSFFAPVSLEQLAGELFKKWKPPELVNKWLHEKPEEPTSSSPVPKRSFFNWREWPGRNKTPETTTTTTTTTKKPVGKAKATDSISQVLSKYGPWGYLMLGMLICGTVLMFCGLWECCFRKPKTEIDPPTSQTQPTTVLIIGHQQEEAANPSPPNYDELDQPPSYTTLFPNFKVNQTPSVRDSESSGHSADSCEEAQENTQESKAKTVSDVTKTKDVVTNKKIYAYFTNEEITEIKSIMKMKDVTGVPFVIGATMLYKFDLLKKLLKDGYNINQTGQNNMTALMWAVKYKYLDIVDYLLNNGADPTIKTDSGDNVLILALEHKLWDEHSMINLWKAVKKVSFIDVNFTSKNGHNMLHMCVRRDWEELLKILLLEKPNVDAGNSNGVTPLMLSCFRNNIAIIDILIEAGADILKEDNHGRMTLCYAISSAMKISKPPLLATEKIIAELKKKSSLETYLKRRLELIIVTAKKSEISCATSEMLIKIIHFSVQYIDEGIRIFLECDVFTQLLEVIETRLDNPGTDKFLLEVCEEILFYNEQSVNYNSNLHNQIFESFCESGFADVCLEIITRNQPEVSKIAFNLLILAFISDDRWKTLLEENYKALLPFINDYQISSQDEVRVKILKNKKRKLKKIFESLEIIYAPFPEASDKNSDEKKKSDNGVNYSKKSRRRSKAIKAKLTKMKSAELTKRLNLNGKKLTQQKPFRIQPKTESVQKLEFFPQTDEVFRKENPIVSSLQYLLDINVDVNNKTPEKPETFPKWQKPISGISHVDICKNFPIDQEKLSQAVEQLKLSTIQDLQKNFDQLIKSVKELAHKDLEQCFRSIKKIESTILSYEVRGIKILSYVAGMENFTMKYSTTNSKLFQNPKLVVDHVQNVLNNLEEPRKDINIEITDEIEDVSFIEAYKSETPIELYYREMSMIGKPPSRNKRKDIEAKLNTIANGFHLINSIMSVCDDEIEDRQNYQKIYGISDLNHPLQTKSNQKSVHYPEISEYMPKRLKSQISSLQNAKSFQKLLGGEIRISNKEQRVNYIISAGINFNAVELGLDINNQPLAVKRIPRESWVGKIIKTLVDPLLGLIESHILHYFACEYEGNELILATPLCKWNMSQYVQLLRQSSATTVPGLTAVQIVKQFLDGLMILHKCEMPIVHGNLKPSNIFIDFNGIVKIAEFGIHKALYKIIEAPKSSLIWFAKETLDIYGNSSIVECSLKSDIQVAGMLIYYMLTYGKHPFGDDTEEILKNIKRGIPKLNARNLDLRDLLLWMMLNDFNERPNIEQVLSHTFFWSPSKKWSFILCCSGINQSGYLLPINVDKLHRSIDSFSDAYIKIEWQELIRNKFPNMRLNDNNNVVGLLKFIKSCHDRKLETNSNDSDLSCTILSLFPILPVVLYRTLQNTNWLKHAVFMPFSERLVNGNALLHPYNVLI
ncbi:uncharacterized protein BDFB_001381 [Asbolus verrucosus]|uniref:Protein kinase domain-containing protein n=1 Tax=Asbolus verrucosus TaxID=1661398 RepID=A0A482W9T9_ASBVE|nr:uncharacterized protein BDFB_001381 [Asbolus verrucosus]